jgi:hypothetical protein
VAGRKSLLKKFQMRNLGTPIPNGSLMNLTTLSNHQNENQMQSYSYEKIKDDPNISINMGLLHKINGGDNANGNIGRNLQDPKSGANTAMMTSLGQNSGEGGNTTVENDERQKTNTV